MPVGRRALVQDTTPGKVLALALLGNLPILLAFVLAPLVSGGAPGAAFAFVPIVLWLTPPFAIGSLFVFFRAPRERRKHRAARIGVMLDAVALALWALVLVAIL